MTLSTFTSSAVFRRVLVAGLGAISLLASAAALALDDVSGDVLLTISGDIGTTNAGDTAVFDLALLEALPQRRFTTTTIWTEGTHEFTGVSLNDLMAAVGAGGTNLKASAINDYSVDIPMSDAVAGGAMVAYRMDGKPMSVRDKGPLWVVYPFDDNPDYQSESVYSRSIWQLDRLQVTD